MKATARMRGFVPIASPRPYQRLVWGAVCAVPYPKRESRGGLSAWIGVGVLLGLLPFLSACVPQGATYRFGASTSEIAGAIDVEDPGTSGPPLVLVYQYHYKFIDFGQGADPGRASADLVHPGEELTHPTASLAYVAIDGSFSIPVPTDVVAVEAFFIAPDRLTDLFQFRKQVGVGRIVYRPKLPRMPDWRNHFYTYLVPELEHVIVEARYELPVQDQQALSTWVTDQRKRLEDRRARSQPSKPKDES